MEKTGNANKIMALLAGAIAVHFLFCTWSLDLERNTITPNKRQTDFKMPAINVWEDAGEDRQAAARRVIGGKFGAGSNAGKVILKFSVFTLSTRTGMSPVMTSMIGIGFPLVMILIAYLMSRSKPEPIKLPKIEDDDRKKKPRGRLADRRT